MSVTCRNNPSTGASGGVARVEFEVTGQVAGHVADLALLLGAARLPKEGRGDALPLKVVNAGYRSGEQRDQEQQRQEELQVDLAHGWFLTRLRRGERHAAKPPRHPEGAGRRESRGSFVKREELRK